MLPPSHSNQDTAFQLQMQHIITSACSRGLNLGGAPVIGVKTEELGVVLPGFHEAPDALPTLVGGHACGDARRGVAHGLDGLHRGLEGAPVLPGGYAVRLRRCVRVRLCTASRFMFKRGHQYLENRAVISHVCG